MDNNTNIKESIGEIVGTMVITTDEYKDLVRRSVMLDVLLSHKVDRAYPSEIEREVVRFRTFFGLDADEKPEERDDAE